MGRAEGYGPVSTEVVIDASAALSWILKTQRTDAAFAFLGESDTMTFITPFIFPWEAANVLLRLVNRGRLAHEDYWEASADLTSFDIQFRPPFEAHPVEAFAVDQRLSLFDAAYLSLALERRSALASRDADLLHAADRAGVATWDLR